jgi:hypothetical protein
VENNSLIEYKEIAGLNSLSIQIKNDDIRAIFLRIFDILKGNVDRLLTTEEKSEILNVKSYFTGSNTPRTTRTRTRLDAAAAAAASLKCPGCGNNYNNYSKCKSVVGHLQSCNGIVDRYTDPKECRAAYTHKPLECGQTFCHNCWWKNKVCNNCGESIEPEPLVKPSFFPYVILLGIFISTKLPPSIISQIQSLSGFAFIILMLLFVLDSRRR